MIILAYWFAPKQSFYSKLNFKYLAILINDYAFSFFYFKCLYFLISKDYKVTVLDLMIYGEDVIEDHKNLQCIKGDIRDICF